jgi:hypothetical protein
MYILGPISYCISVIIMFASNIRFEETLFYLLSEFPISSDTNNVNDWTTS